MRGYKGSMILSIQVPALKIIDNTYIGNGDIAVTINKPELLNTFGGFRKVIGGANLREDSYKSKPSYGLISVISAYYLYVDS